MVEAPKEVKSWDTGQELPKKVHKGAEWSWVLIMFWVERHHDLVQWQHVWMWDLGNKVMRIRKGSKYNISMLGFPNEVCETLMPWEG